MSSTRLILTACLIAASSLVAGCSAHRRATGDQEPIRTTLEEAPLWTAAAAWDRSGEHLVLLDPGSHRLLTYDLDGKVVGRVPLDPMASLDYSTPIRLLPSKSGFLLGDKTKILRLDEELGLVGTTDVFGPLSGDGITAGTLNDFVVVGENLYGYADFVRAGSGGEEGEDEWHRGFLRISLDEHRLTPLQELSLEDGEFTEYYFYDRRPYVTSLGRRVFVLRHNDPPSVCPVTPTGLETGWAVESEGLRVVALHGWNGRLFVLLARRDRMEEAARLVEAGRSREEVRETLGIGQGPLPPDPKQWVLLTLDPRSGKQLGRQELPTRAERLHLVPGDRYWALIEESSGPNTGEEASAAQVVFVPSGTVESGGEQK